MQGWLVLGETKAQRDERKQLIPIRFKAPSGSLWVSPSAPVLGPLRQMGTQDQGQRQGKVCTILQTLLSCTPSGGWGVEPVTLLPGQDPHQMASTVTYPTRVTSLDQKARTESLQDRAR